MGHCIRVCGRGANGKLASSLFTDLFFSPLRGGACIREERIGLHSDSSLRGQLSCMGVSRGIPDEGRHLSCQLKSDDNVHGGMQGGMRVCRRAYVGWCHSSGGLYLQKYMQVQQMHKDSTEKSSLWNPRLEPRF
ncbi:hypothetical protein DUNSADRAFT_16085 [Dunaliella salina]|uniref:Encoded protein n=1 Tax=Dunaliella salina TaxID=3046 RepID=A0ABQ7G478_DUNSA|nr:hypothetical protein DUNSADRAFT_16085 [Dunaliella salina]|eukprot:KAF5829425.1 hypothetical protein DUNSADRAFT_16085 [Dunaliella salina]